jgi:hypothetical protein
VLGDSGIVVGAAVDLGKESFDSLVDAGIDINTVFKLERYIGKKQRNGYDLRAILTEDPLYLTDVEAQELSNKIKERDIQLLVTIYNESRKEEGLNFEDLPLGVRTAIASFYFQFGAELWHPDGHVDYWYYITNQHWRQAIEKLVNYGDNYPTRRLHEA